MDFLVYLVVYIIVWALTDLLTPAPDIEGREAGKLSKENFPMATESKPVMVIMGDVWVRNTNVLWWGDVSIDPVKEKACSGTLFKKCTRYAVGYRYHAGIHCGICVGPIDKFLGIKAGDSVIWTGDKQSGTIFVNQENMWGGDKGKGGVSGTIDLLSGSYSQDRNTYLISNLGPDISAYRGIASVVLRGNNQYSFDSDGVMHMNTKGFYIGVSTVPKVFSFRLKWLPVSLSLEFSSINGQANPAHMIYEIYTSNEFGSSVPASAMDIDSFMAVAETYYNEGIGLKLSWSKQLTIQDIVDRLLQITDSVIYPNPTTGKITIKAVRPDYNIGDLQVLGEDEIKEYVNFSRSAWHETTNEVRVNFNETTDTGEKERCAIQQDLGNLHIQLNERVSTTFEFPQISDPAVASKVAGMLLAKLSYPLAKCEIVVNRKAFNLVPGSVFIYSRPSRGIANVVMRVGNYAEENVRKGYITIRAIQDIFGVSNGVYATPPPSVWVPPDNTPNDVGLSSEDEMPYMFTDDDSYAKPWIFVFPPTGMTSGYDMYIDDNDGFILENSNAVLSRICSLNADINQTDTTIVINGHIDLEEPEGDQSLGSTLFKLNGELISYSSAYNNQDGTWDLAGCQRGLLDTVPSNHSQNDILWLEVMREAQTSNNVYSNTADVDLKYLTKTPAGTLDISVAGSHSLQFDSRALKPYVPGRVRVNSETYEGEIDYEEARLTWNTRNRLTQTEYIVTQTQSSITAETGTTYDLDIYAHDGTLLRSETGITDSHYTYNEADELADNGTDLLEESLTFKLRSKLGTLFSWQDQSIHVTRDFTWVGLLKGGTASASTEYSSTYAASKAFDKNTNTRWSSTTSDTYPRTLTYDLGNGNDVTALSFKLKPCAGKVKTYKIQGSTDASTWDDLFSGVSPDSSDTIEETLATTGSYRYYRVSVSDDYDSDYTEIYEFNVYN